MTMEKFWRWVGREYGGIGELILTIAVVIALSFVLGYLVSLAF